jgi:hypothetical protein
MYGACRHRRIDHLSVRIIALRLPHVFRCEAHASLHNNFRSPNALNSGRYPS